MPKAKHSNSRKLKRKAANCDTERAHAPHDRQPSTLGPVHTTLTKNGKPVARLEPIVGEEKDPIFGFYAGKITVPDDIESITIPLEDWTRLK